MLCCPNDITDDHEYEVMTYKQANENLSGLKPLPATRVFGCSFCRGRGCITGTFAAPDAAVSRSVACTLFNLPFFHRLLPPSSVVSFLRTPLLLYGKDHILIPCLLHFPIRRFACFCISAKRVASFDSNANVDLLWSSTTCFRHAFVHALVLLWLLP